MVTLLSYNLTTLGNLMIGNPRSVNDAVVFLKAKTNLKFLDLNIISQIFGAQVKSGVRPSAELGGNNSRGIFSACCPIPDMPNFCRRLGVHGVIQVDTADAYYFNENEDWYPTMLLKGTGARQIANSLVLEAIQNKCAYPIINYINGDQAFIGVNDSLAPGDHKVVADTGALFPEFNFHNNNLNDHLEYCSTTDIIFQKGGALNALTITTNCCEYFDIGQVKVPIFSLNKILETAPSATAYLNFQKNMYQFEQIDNYPWVIPYRNYNGVLQVNPFIVNRDHLINDIFKSNQEGELNALPYLCDPTKPIPGQYLTIINFEAEVANLIFSDHLPINICGIATTKFPSHEPGHKNEKPLGRQNVFTARYGGKKSRKRKKTVKRKKTKRKSIGKRKKSGKRKKTYKRKNKKNKKNKY